MKISTYFETAIGRGVLATADAHGKVEVALHGRPCVIDEETVAFPLLDRMSRQNLRSNPHAAYLFMEEGPEFTGKRLFLTRIDEEHEPELLESLRRRMHLDLREKDETIVYFRVDEVLPLVSLEERKEVGSEA